MEQWTVSFALGLFEAAIAFVALFPSFIIIYICELGFGRTGFHPTILARGCKVSNPCTVAPQGCSLWWFPSPATHPEALLVYLNPRDVWNITQGIQARDKNGFWTYSNQGALVYRNICWNLGCRKTKLECGSSNTNVPPRAMIKSTAKAVLASMGTLPRQGFQWPRESLGVEFRFEMVSLMQASTFWWAAKKAE